MDIATVLGILLAIAAVFGPIIMSGTMHLFIDLPSVYIVLVGALSGVMTSVTMSDVLGIFSVTKNALFSKSYDLGRIVDSMVDLGEKARREGILALEREMGRLDDPFMKKAMQLAVDGNEPEVIENVMSTEIENIEARHAKGRKFFESLGELAPAFGMLGTLIGLIQMLDSLDDPSNIGSGMAVALVTTFYGSCIANMVSIPLAKKLALRSDEEVLVKNMVLFGVLSIHSGDNPRVTRDKLETFVPPKFRKGDSR